MRLHLQKSGGKAKEMIEQPENRPEEQRANKEARRKIRGDLHALALPLAARLFLL